MMVDDEEGNLMGGSLLERAHDRQAGRCSSTSIRHATQWTTAEAVSRTATGLRGSKVDALTYNHTDETR